MTKKEEKAPRSKECEDCGITLFNTYAGAALAASKVGVLKIDAVVRVALACIEELSTVSLCFLTSHRYTINYCIIATDIMEAWSLRQEESEMG